MSHHDIYDISLQFANKISLLSLTPEDLKSFGLTTNNNSPDVINNNAVTAQDLFQDSVIILGALLYQAYDKRPRGMSREDLIEIRKSTKIKNNLGVFSKKFITAGTVIGHYPGYIKDISVLSRNNKSKNIKNKFLWDIDDKYVLDPTTSENTIELEISYLFGLIKIPTTLARMNEPPLGEDCNVYPQIKEFGLVEIIAERDIFSNEEIYIDYGPNYDRSDYIDTSNQEALEKERKMIKKREEEEMLTIQSVVLNSDNLSQSKKLDQSTSIPKEGFISKLSLKNDTKLNSDGIISPESALKMFNDQGTTMFSPLEDQELIKSITGKTKLSSIGSAVGGKEKQNKVETSTSVFASKSLDDELLTIMNEKGLDLTSSPNDNNNDEEEEDLEDAELTSLLSKIKQETEPNSSDDKINEQNLLNNENLFGRNIEQVTQNFQVSEPFINIKKEENNGNNQVNTPKTILSKEEADSIQRRLDNLTDEQIEKVFAKLRVSINDKLQSEFKNKVDERKAALGKEELPKSRTVDPTVRTKYDEELKAIEAELEKLYNDPVNVWKDLMANSEKYKDDTPGTKPEDLFNDTKK
eukprot:gene13357-17916_t